MKTGPQIAIAAAIMGIALVITLISALVEAL